MKTLKRTLAFILVMTMLLSLGEGMALAAGTDTAADGVSQLDQDGTILPVPSSEVGEEPSVPPAEESGEPSAPPAEESGEPSTPPTEESGEPSAPPTEEGGEPSAPPTEEGGEPSAPPAEEGGEPPAPPTEDPEATVSPEPSEEPEEETEHKVWPWTEPGNSVSSLMGDGTMLTSGGGTYYSENGGLYVDGTLLASVDACYLNMADGWLYYSAGDGIYRLPAGGGSAETVYAAGAAVAQMYVMGQEIRYLAGGSVYSYDMNDGAVERLEAPEGLVKFIPTPYGNLYLTGSVFNYTLWAEMTQLYGGISQCYTEGDWLVVVAGGETMQAAVAPMFEGSFSLQSYSLHQDKLAQNGLSDEQQLANEQAYLQSADYAASIANETEYADNGIATISTSQFLTAPLSANQQNIVMRAQQMSEVQWTCKVDRYAWGGDDGSYITTKSYDPIYKAGGKFYAGKTYKGVPYSQAVSTGYVGWDISLSKFLEAAADANSVFYKNYSSFSKTAPYYGSDCSGFVSYAWDLPYRCTCSSLLNFSSAIGNDVQNIQIGDALNNPNSHVILITDVAYNASGAVISVETTEQTPPKMKVTIYGEKISGKGYDSDGGTLVNLTSKFNQGYSLYRRSCSSRPNVNRPADVVGTSLVDAPTMEVTPVGPNQASVTLRHATAGAQIYYTTDGTAPSTGSTGYTAPFSVGGATVNVRAMARVGSQDSFPLNETLTSAQAPTLAVAGESNGNSVFKYDNKFYVDNDVKNLTILSDSGATIYYTTDGATPTVNSAQGTAGSLTISIDKTLVVKAFAWAPGSIPSAVAEFHVEKGSMHKITINDSFGLIAPSQGIVEGGVLAVLDGADVTLEILKSTDTGIMLDYIVVDGEKKDAPDSYTFPNVKEDHTITAVLKSDFADVSGSSWYAGAVAYCKAKGLFTGTSASNFSPSGSITRAMFVAVLGRFAKPSISLYGQNLSGGNWEKVDYQLAVTRGSDINVRSGAGTGQMRVAGFDASGQYLKVLSSATASNGVLWYQVQYNANGSKGYVSSVYSGKTIVDACRFSDLQGSGYKSVTYAYGYAQWAYLNGIVNGMNSTLFGSKTAISREDICVMLYNYLTKYYGRSVSTTAAKTFADSGSISGYAKDAVNAMVNIGILQGDTNNKIQPKAAATRSQVATMFMRLDQYLNP